jgi:hypothetical protein
VDDPDYCARDLDALRNYRIDWDDLKTFKPPTLRILAWCRLSTLFAMRPKVNQVIRQRRGPKHLFANLVISVIFVIFVIL